ncbi:MAG: ABC transporter substrate-binding protein [Prolixibacteraceae bacterium]
MKKLINQLLLPVILIIGTSALLLLSDLVQQGKRMLPAGTDASSSANETGKHQDYQVDKTRIIDFAQLKENNQQPTTDELLQAGLFLNLSVRIGRPAEIILINLVDNPVLEQAIAGVEAGLTGCGLTTGKDYRIKRYSAQGEVAQLPQITDAALRENPDAIVTVTTPVFITAARKIRDIPLIFTVASNPARLGIYTNKRPANICGVYDNPPVDKLLRMASRFNSKLKNAGIIYDAAQINSLISVEKLRLAGEQQDIQILEATASVVSDLGLAARSLIQRGAQVIIISADNMAYTGFPAIKKVADAAGIPIYTTELELVEQGASAGIGNNIHDWGKQSGELLAKVLAGVPPSLLPVMETDKQQVIDPAPSKISPAQVPQPY